MSRPPADAQVLHVMASNRRRGAEVFAIDLSEALTGLGWPGRTFALTGGGPLRPDGQGSGRFDPPTLNALRRAVLNADVVIAHGSSTLLASYLATLATGVPYVYRSIGDPTHWVDSRQKRWRVGHMLRHAAHVVALWPWAREQLSRQYGLSSDRVTVIPNGVDVRRFRLPTATERAAQRSSLGVASSTPVAVLIGSLTPDKDPITALRAAAALPELHLVVAGDGPLRTEAEAAAAELMPGRSVFVSAVEDVVPVLAAADVVLLTSRTEGLPGVLIEAGLCGVPSVATDVGGVGEIVDDGVTGVLVPPGRPDLTAAGLEQVLASSRSMGECARVRCIAQFDLEKVAQLWSKVISSVARP